MEKRTGIVEPCIPRLLSVEETYTLLDVSTGGIVYFTKFKIWRLLMNLILHMMTLHTTEGEFFLNLIAVYSWVAQKLY